MKKIFKDIKIIKKERKIESKMEKTFDYLLKIAFIIFIAISLILYFFSILGFFEFLWLILIGSFIAYTMIYFKD